MNGVTSTSISLLAESLYIFRLLAARLDWRGRPAALCVCVSLLAECTNLSELLAACSYKLGLPAALCKGVDLLVYAGMPAAFCTGVDLLAARRKRAVRPAGWQHMLWTASNRPPLVSCWQTGQT